MSHQPSHAPRPAYRHSLRLECACTFEGTGGATHFARSWLAEQGLTEAEVGNWVSVLMEAGNNAVEYVSPERQALPIALELAVGESEVEVRVIDHTPGFELPAHVELPDLDSEGGRGLYIIKSLTDHAAYLRGAGENHLLLRKGRTAAALPTPDPLALQRQFAESEIAVAELSEELASSYESLVAMFRYSAELGRNANLQKFTERLLEDILQLTETDAAVVRLFNDARLETFLVWPPELQAGVPGLAGLDPGRSAELEALQSREDVWFDAAHPLPPNDPLQAISGARLGVVHAVTSADQQLGTITVIRRRSDALLRSAQVNILHTLVDFLAIQIVNARLLDERTQTRITRRELEIAANIQRSLLPVSIPSRPPFAVAASCTNAREVGGDFFDVIRVGDAGLLLFIADVMGKGVPAALFAAVLRSAVRSMPTLFKRPAALLAAVNHTLHDDLSRVDMFATAQAVYLDVKRQQITAASAGHSPLLLWHPGCRKTEVADDAGLPLGIHDDAAYSATVTPFPPGALALMFTDGLNEMRDGSGAMLGIGGLEALLPDLAPDRVPASQMSAALLAALDAFRAGVPLNDDQTFVILRHEP